MFIQDRFTKGVIAGFAAGMITKIYDLITFYFGLSTIRWMDISGVMIFGRKPTYLSEKIFATMGAWFFHALLGVVFIFLLQRLFNSKNLYFKGWFYAVFWWFVIYAIIQLLKVPEISFVPVNTSVSNFFGASIWGLVMAFIVDWQEKITKRHSPS